MNTNTNAALRTIADWPISDPANIAQPPQASGDPTEPRDDSDRSYDRPIGYLPAYELGRLHSGHDANLRSAKFGPSALGGDVPVYLEAQPPAGWLPIDTAPKDGTRVILSWGCKAINGFYLDNGATEHPWQGWRTESMVPRPAGSPDAWQPFPRVDPEALAAAPKAAKAEPQVKADASPLNSVDASVKAEPVQQSAPRKPLDMHQMAKAVREAHVEFCLDKYPSFEHALIRNTEAAHGIQPAHKEQP